MESESLNGKEKPGVGKIGKSPLSRLIVFPHSPRQLLVDLRKWILTASIPISSSRPPLLPPRRFVPVCVASLTRRDLEDIPTCSMISSKFWTYGFSVLTWLSSWIPSTPISSWLFLLRPTISSWTTALWWMLRDPATVSTASTRRTTYFTFRTRWLVRFRCTPPGC